MYVVHDHTCVRVDALLIRRISLEDESGIGILTLYYATNTCAIYQSRVHNVSNEPPM